MNKKVKKLWLKALRSGEYEQGREYLVTTSNTYDKFCCLGVLCDIYARTHKSSKGFTEGPWDRKTLNFEDASFIKGTCMNSTIQENSKVGIWSDIGPYCDELTYMNDEDKKSFLEIADWIEENL